MRTQPFAADVVRHCLQRLLSEWNQAIRKEGNVMYCMYCGSAIGSDEQFCSSCGRRQNISLPPPRAQFTGHARTESTPLEQRFGYSTGREIGDLLRRYPLWCAAFALFVVAFIGWVNLRDENQAGTQTTGGSQVATQEPEAIVRQRQHMHALADVSRKKEQTLLQTNPPKFYIFRARRNEIVSYVVAAGTTEQQLKRLLWLFREKARSGKFKEIGITQPTAKQWGVDGYNSGMLVVYRGEKCADEPYVSLKQAEAGRLGACGYGEHDAAEYQWGINADPNKDSGDIRNKDGNSSIVFDYRDNWKPSAAAPN
jgi:hypothetical protein